MPPKANCSLRECGRKLNTNVKRYSVNSEALKQWIAEYLPEDEWTQIQRSPSAVICARCRDKVLKPLRKKCEDGVWRYDSNKANRNQHSSEGPEEHESPHQSNEAFMQSTSMHEYAAMDESPTISNSLSSEEASSSSTIESTSSSHCESAMSMSLSMGSSIQLTQPMDTIRLSGMKSIVATQRRCCVCGCLTGRCRIPILAIMHAWSEVEVTIPEGNRCCKSHLSESRFTPEALELIKKNPSLKMYTLMNRSKVSSWILDMTKFFKSQRTILNFGKDTRFTSTDFEALLGVTRDNFEIMFEHCNQSIKNSKNRTSRNALAILLMKLRLNLSQRVMAILFGMSSLSSVSRAMSAVLKCLVKTFVPLHLGFKHKTREELLKNHSRKFFTIVLQADPEDLILICDGTYLYIQKPSDMEALKKTFSQHKYCNLFKSMMIVCPDGLILAAEGLFYADGSNNDTKIFKSMLRNENSILSILETRDKVIIDRGFRGCEDDLNQMGIDYFMPKFLKKDQQQFTCIEANETRQVTACRFIVETANGRPKNKFNFFDHKILASYFPKLGDLWSLALSMINAFSPPLFTDSDFHMRMAEKILKQIEKPTNTLMDEVLSWKEDAEEPRWVAANQDSVLEFPSLTREDIYEICLGSYQPRLASLYNKQHLSDTVGYKFYVAKREQGLIKVKMQSRHVRRQKYIVWIRFTEHGNGYESIRGHYCKCKVGTRNVGCCAHIAAVLCYLGYERFEEGQSHRDLYSSILDAAEELAKGEGEEQEDVEFNEDSQASSDIEESEDEDDM